MGEENDEARSDIMSAEKRSYVMSQVRSKDTKPEIKVRSALHRAGFRFRLHATDLPGKPDIVLPKYNTVVEVHGCFWHRHDCKKGNQLPDTNREFWENKLERNEERDRENRKVLQDQGWKVLTVWECELNQSPEATIDNLIKELSA